MRVFSKGAGRVSSVLGRARRRRFRSQRFAEMVRHNPTLVRPRGPEYLGQVRQFWEQHYGRPVNPRWHVACANVTGVEDVRYMPHDVWWDDVIPFFNDMSLFAAYSDKNLYGLLLRDCEAPATVVKRMHGRYYDGAHGALPSAAVMEKICADRRDKILKPSRTDNGEGIRKITVADGKPRIEGKEVAVADIEQQYGKDFLVQAVVVQHAVMAEVHPESVNTLRLLTVRWGDAVRLLMCFARFGAHGRINDNAGTGGVCCGVNDDGRMNAVAVDEYGRAYTTHPSTGYAFAARRQVPGFDGIRSHVIALHGQIPHFDLASWDIAVDPQSRPVFIEVNFRGASFIYQYACNKPILGDLTTEVLGAIRATRRPGR